MNKPFYNPENIESYLANKMSASDKALFENELAKDPLLSNEISLQKDIVESLKAFRKAELKNRLNNIEVTIGSSYTGIKVAASVILASLLSFGTYSYFTHNQPKGNNELSEQVVSNNNNSIKNNNSSSIVIEPKENIIPENNKIKVSEKDKVSGINKRANKKITNTVTIAKTEEELTLPTNFNSHEVKDKFEDSEKFQTENEIQMPKGEVGQSTHQNNINDLHIEVKNVRKQFHYQYYNNKLFLYGDFDSNPYEIFELNSRKDKELYLFYNNEFYGLKQSQTRITPLQMIKDQEKLNALNALRNKK
jgi:hypothetical protein